MQEVVPSKTEDTVVAIRAEDGVVAAVALHEIVAGVADDGVAETVAFQRERTRAIDVAGLEHLDLLSGIAEAKVNVDRCDDAIDALAGVFGDAVV